MGQKSKEMVDTYDILGHVVTKGVYSRSEALVSDELLLGAVIILFDEDGNMLIQKRKGNRSYSGKWDFTAGGGAQTGETSKDTVEREFREETGLNYSIEVGEPVAVSRTKNWLIVYYAQTVKRKEFESYGTLESDEVSEFKWISITKFVEMFECGEFRGDIKPNVQRAIKDICKVLRERGK